MVALLLLPAAPAARGASAWFDSAWPFRRPIDVAWEAERAGGDELCEAQFYTAGRHQPDGADVRVATDEGRVLPSRVLMVGPGDRVSVVFQLVKGVRKYYAFFGHPNPPPPSKATEDVPYKAGLVMETKVWTGGQVENFQQVEASWDRCKELVGRTMVPNLYLGMNPFDDRAQVISRYKGAVFAPLDGPYEFAGSAHSKAGLYLDGKPLLFMPGLVGDVRFSAKADLKRGRHEVVVLQVTGDGDPRLSVVWKRPDALKTELIGKEAFGLLGLATVGALEERGKSLTADFKAEYAAECFYAYHYSHRYKFSANVAPALAKNAALRVEWDFGDGQSASGPAAEHVYLADGEYPVRVKFTIGGNSDAQVTKFAVRRNRETILKPPTDEPPAQSALVARYNAASLPAPLLPWATILHARAKTIDPMLAAGVRLAALGGAEAKDVNPDVAAAALQEAAEAAVAAGRADAAVKLWDAAPRDSKLQPRAATRLAALLLWRTAEFARAAQALEPFASAAGAPPKLRREYAEALVLSGKADEGRKILTALPIEGPPEQRPARSGSMARTVESYIREGDAEAGEEHWERWQNAYPSDFLEGYSVLFQTKLMELAKTPEPAAKVAEAFVTAVPRSTYAPALLDRASKLLAASNPAKSKSLRDLLKQKYPEDPLSQD